MNYFQFWNHFLKFGTISNFGTTIKIGTILKNEQISNLVSLLNLVQSACTLAMLFVQYSMLGSELRNSVYFWALPRTTHVGFSN